jgi:hypothetical protein
MLRISAVKFCLAFGIVFALVRWSQAADIHVGDSLALVKRVAANGTDKQIPAHATAGERAISFRFPLDDPIYRAAKRAYDDVCSLCMDLHYLSCQSGVGREPRE